MPLREEFAATGSFLFRWRSYFPIAALAVVTTQMAVRAGVTAMSPTPFWKWAAMVMVLIGLTTRFYVVGHAPRGTSGRNTRCQVCDELNTTGAYSMVRHPLYLGNFFIWLGVALLPGFWWLATMVGLVFWLYYERIMYAEEEFLRRKFGPRYFRWARNTPAFLPDVRLFVRPALAFSWRTVLRREYSGVFAVIATFSLLALSERWSVQGHPLPSSAWSGGLALAAVVYVTLRGLKKHTRWLEVDGR